MDTIPPLSLPILLDGATGSELYKRGMPAGALSFCDILSPNHAAMQF